MKILRILLILLGTIYFLLHLKGILYWLHGSIPLLGLLSTFFAPFLMALISFYAAHKINPIKFMRSAYFSRIIQIVATLQIMMVAYTLWELLTYKNNFQALGGNTNTIADPPFLIKLIYSHNTEAILSSLILISTAFFIAWDLKKQGTPHD